MTTDENPYEPPYTRNPRLPGSNRDAPSFPTTWDVAIILGGVLVVIVLTALALR